MATRLEITCINKSDRMNPYERITHVGGRRSDATRWKFTQETAIKELKDGTYTFFVRKDGKEVEVVLAKHDGHDYIKTQPDGLHPNNLLSLPECA